MPEITCDDGVRLHYESIGSNSASPALLIQGVGVVGNGWRPQLDGLADRHRVVAFDNRGIGRSTASASKLSIERMADDAIAIVDALGLGRALIVGHSMGGVIAMALALQSPERVDALLA